MVAVGSSAARWGALGVGLAVLAAVGCSARPQLALSALAPPTDADNAAAVELTNARWNPLGYVPPLYVLVNGDPIVKLEKGQWTCFDIDAGQPVEIDVLTFYRRPGEILLTFPWSEYRDSGTWTLAPDSVLRLEATNTLFDDMILQQADAAEGSEALDASLRVLPTVAGQ